VQPQTATELALPQQAVKKRRLLALVVWFLVCICILAPLAAISYHAVPARMFGWIKLYSTSPIHISTLEAHLIEAPKGKWPDSTNGNFYSKYPSSTAGNEWVYFPARTETTGGITTVSGATLYRGFIDSYRRPTLDSCCLDAFVVAITVLTWVAIIFLLWFLFPSRRVNPTKSILHAQSSIGDPPIGQNIGPTGQKRSGLASMNILFLLYYGYIHQSAIFGPSSMNEWFATILNVFILGGPCALGFLAATNPNHETRRKLAKWSNLPGLTFTIICAFYASGSVATVIGLIILSFPAFVNVWAFWKKSDPSVWAPSEIVPLH
jgi:hypothetical protein